MKSFKQHEAEIEADRKVLSRFLDTFLTMTIVGVVIIILSVHL